MFFPLYIDPGTGSMLFSLIIGLIAAGSFGLRALYLKFKFVFLGGNKESNIDSKKIPYLIFSDHKRYWNVFKPICDEFEKRGIGIAYWTASPDDPALSEKYEHVKAEFIGEGNKAFARLNMMNAGICLSTTPGLDVYQWKRSKNVEWYVHIPHDASELLGYRMFGLDFYDAVLLTGKFQEHYIRSLEKMRNIKQKELFVAGSTYLDAMHKKLALYHTSTEKNHTSVVLLAPSWGKDGILTKYGSKIIEALKSTDFEIIVRPHPQTISSEKDVIEPLLKAYPESDKFHWNYDNDNFSVLAKSDIMITDFSGIILDYTFVFGKTLIYADTSYDTAPYDAAWFNETNWRLQILPELGTRLDENDFPNMKKIIEKAMQNKTFEENRKRISDEAWQNKGNAAKLVVDYLIQKSEVFSSSTKSKTIS